MAGDITLLSPAGVAAPYSLRPARTWPACRFHAREAYAAAHVVADVRQIQDPTADATLDWDATLAYRHYLWSQGLAVAEAMDTAQRGGGLPWKVARELIWRSAAEAQKVGGAIASGAGTDQLGAEDLSLQTVEAAYEEQCRWIEDSGSSVVVMASRHLAAVAQSADDYRRVYDRVLSRRRRPVILHWLGDMFDPALQGYWGFSDVAQAMEVCLAIIQQHRDRVVGIKVSLLDADLEVAMRNRLPSGVRMYTGDDFHFTDLIAGDERGYSHALLGILDAIAPAAANALAALDAGDLPQYRALMEPAERLGRHLFEAPTRWYKVGIVFLAYLNGFQSHFRLLGGIEGSRSILHFCEAFRLADDAGLLRDPDLAIGRMRTLLQTAGVV